MKRTLNRDFRAVLVWALLLGGLTAGQFAFMDEAYSYWLLGGAAGVTAVVALYLVSFRSREPALRALPDGSYAAVCLAVGAATAAIGSIFGPWLTLPGLGLVVLGLGGLARELVATRRRA